MRRDGSFSILRIMNQRSSIPRCQEHWPRLRIGTCGQRLKLLNASTIFSWFYSFCHRTAIIQVGRGTRHKSTRVHLCLEGIIRSALTRRQQPLGTDIALTNNVHQSRDRKGEFFNTGCTREAQDKCSIGQRTTFCRHDTQ